jgi:hypothetical protein
MTRPPSGPRATGPALEAMYQLLLWLVPTLEKFPKSQKFQLGDRIQSTAMAVLDELIAATFTRARMGHLNAANLGLERLRVLLRLANDLRHLDHRRYEHAVRLVDQVGRLVGGWRRAHGARGEDAHGARGEDTHGKRADDANDAPEGWTDDVTPT